MKQTTDKLSLDMIRQILAIIELKDIENEKEQSGQERKEYCASISAVFPRLEKDIKRLLYEQLIKTSMQAETWEQVLVGRGVFAGMEILLEHWKLAHAEHSEKGAKENFNPNNPISEF